MFLHFSLVLQEYLVDESSLLHRKPTSLLTKMLVGEKFLFGDEAVGVLQSFDRSFDE
jgi:hypothetical protein